MSDDNKNKDSKKDTSKAPPLGGGGSVTGKTFDWRLLKRVMHYVKPYITVFIISAFLTVFLAFRPMFYRAK